ncbi:MAG: curli biogenesis system outer membrane secretion channel CsgG [Paraglaciecola sp.]|jgi:curli biogenesis system outer membrane secretion channel CsgG
MKRISGALCVISLCALSACTSSTKQNVNKIKPTQAQISPSLAMENEKQLKRKVAIARFSDETKNGSSFFVDKNNDQIGKQASDILSARLTESGKFLIFERTDLDKIQKEQNIAQVNPDMVGADYLIIGSVSEFGRKTTSETAIFSRNKIQIASATVNVRLVDTANGQIVFSQEAKGEARAEANTVFGVGERAAFDTTLNDKAISAAISKLVSNLMENLLDKPWKAYLIGEQDGYYIMTGGKSQGINSGDVFDLWVAGKKIKNPQTGLFIELPGEKVGQVEVMQTLGNNDNEISLVKADSSMPKNTPLDSIVVKESK